MKIPGIERIALIIKRIYIDFSYNKFIPLLVYRQSTGLGSHNKMLQKPSTSSGTYYNHSNTILRHKMTFLFCLPDRRPIRYLLLIWEKVLGFYILYNYCQCYFRLSQLATPQTFPLSNHCILL